MLSVTNATMDVRRRGVYTYLAFGYHTTTNSSGGVWHRALEEGIALCAKLTTDQIGFLPYQPN